MKFQLFSCGKELIDKSVFNVFSTQRSMLLLHMKHKAFTINVATFLPCRGVVETLRVAAVVEERLAVILQLKPYNIVITIENYHERNCLMMTRKR